MKVGFAILAHDNPRNVARLARHLLEAEGIVAIHFDAQAGEGPLDEVRRHLGSLQDRIVWAKRVEVGWGQWSMIEATLNAVSAIFEAGYDPDYIHLMSAADYPIRPLRDFYDFLERHKGTDFIESHSVNERQWVLDGLVHERYQYRHHFNWKKHPHLFDFWWRLQRTLGLVRTPPRNLVIHMGSQWCTLTAASWKHVLEWSRHKDVVGFFRTCWIPDESFIHTVLATAATPNSNRHLTLYQFSDYGVPVVYFNGHAPHLASQPFFFARKLSPYADALRDELDQVIAGATEEPKFTDEEIGIPTEEYDFFRRSRSNGLRGKRIVGRVIDPWYGDLEWNRKPYFVFVGACAEELDWLCGAIDQLPGFVGHGRLFAERKIGFAGGRTMLAGYDAADVRLRDHKRTNFLVDLIHHFPEDNTAFALAREEGGELFDVLRYDKRSRLVLAKGNLIRAFLESHGHRRTRGQGQEKFRVFAEGYLKFYEAKRLKLKEAEARYTEIDLLSADWRESLSKFMADSLADDALNAPSEARLLIKSPGLVRLDAEHSEASGLDRLAGMISDRRAREQHFLWTLERSQRPFMLVTGASHEETRFIADVLAATRHIHVHDADEAHVSELVKAILSSFDSGSDSIPAFLLHAPDPRPLAPILNVSNASVIYVRGNVLRAVAARLDRKTSEKDAAARSENSLPHCNPGAFRAAYRHYRINDSKWAQLAEEYPRIGEVDLMSGRWYDDLSELLAEMRLASRDARDAASAPLSAAAALQAQRLADPAAVFRNARVLCGQITDEVQREAHLQRLTAEIPPSADMRPVLPLRAAGTSRDG
jgi:hypothetical protein